MAESGNMTFSHTYKTKLDQAGPAAFDTVHKSYIADKESGINDNIYGNFNRDQVMQGVRANLKAKMTHANEASRAEAEQMKAKHDRLRAEIRESVEKIKQAARNSVKLKAKAVAQYKNEDARRSATADAAIDHAINTKANIDENDLSQEEKLKKQQDIDELREIKSGNFEVEQGNIFGNLFRAVGIMKTRGREFSDRAVNEELTARTELQNIKDKAAKWNAFRKEQHESVTYKRYTVAYDEAAMRFHMLNRKGGGGIMPAKEVKEYVGEFDIGTMDSSLSDLSLNPYLTVDVDNMVVDKKSRVRGNADYIKTHQNITLLSEENENGIRTRYKLNSDFRGYKARRQYDPAHPTALTISRDVNKEFKDSKDFKLEADAKDARGEFINSEGNLEIQQMKTGKWFKRTVNGIVLGGIFISSDAQASVMRATDRMKQKEEVRKAVLKASIFTEINSKTIQHAMGYEAGTKADDAIKDIKEELAKAIQSDDGLAGWSMQKKADLEEEKTAVETELFSDTYEDELMDATTHELPNSIVKSWEQILTGNDEKAKKDLPAAAKTKAVYDVIRQEYKLDHSQKDQLENRNTRIGKVLYAVKNDEKVLSDVALMLLADDQKTDYWDMAKTICSKMLLTGFEKKVEGIFDSRYNRALAKAGAGSGQLMRIALIDELTADRSLFDPTDLIGAFMPTRWKQFKEDVEGKRGTGAVLQQKLIDGSLMSGVKDVVSSVTGITDDLKLADDSTVEVMKMVKTYTSALSAAVDMGAITETGAYAINDYVTEDGKLRSGRESLISMVAGLVKKLVKLTGVCVKFYKDRVKEIEKQAKNDPDYDPKEALAFTKSSYYKFITSGIGAFTGVVKSVLSYVNAKQAKTITGLVQNALDIFTGAMDVYNADYKTSLISGQIEEINTLISKNAKNADEEALVEVLKKNSQLQYGLALAKSKSRADKTNGIIGIVSSAGSAVLSFMETFTPKVKKSSVFLVANNIWNTVFTAVNTVTEIVRNKKAKKDNIARMLGEKYRNVDTGVLDEVLKREAGIASTDYLTDLARIFMSINTHVFMKNANSKAEKTLGSQIAQKLFLNDEYTADKLGKVKVKNLMDAMGVKGNFHGILKHALA